MTVNVLTGVIGVLLAAVTLGILHPVLMPLLLVTTVPDGLGRAAVGADAQRGLSPDFHRAAAPMLFSVTGSFPIGWSRRWLGSSSGQSC